MKPSWLLLAVVTAGTGAQAQECRPDVQRLTVYTLEGKTMVPNEVMARARYMATKVLAGAGVTVEWVRGERPRDPHQTYCGERLTIAFDAKASAGFAAQAMAYTRLNAGWSTEIHIFYDRVSAFPDRPRMAEFLGHVLAHEIVHGLQGVVRHSSEGVMKARWNDQDCAQLVRKPLPFAVEDVELIQSHFRTRSAMVAQK
jgi:hypothetical protein